MMQWLSKSHRCIGFSIALIVVLLSVTGIALNHTSSLRLDSTSMPQWSARLFYGVNEKPAEYKVNGASLSVESGRLRVNQHPIAFCSHLNGVLSADQLWVVVCYDSLVLLSSEFELVEQWYADQGFAGGMQRVGLAKADRGALLVADDQGWRWRLNLDTMVLAQTVVHAAVDEVVPVSPLGPDTSAELTVERLMQDLHSGRAVGGWGVWLVDLSALGLLWLTVSGYLSWRAKQKLLSMDVDS